MYVLFERENSDHREISLDNLKYIDGKIIMSNKLMMPTHLIFGVKIKGFSQSIWEDCILKRIATGPR